MHKRLLSQLSRAGLVAALAAPLVLLAASAQAAQHDPANQPDHAAGGAHDQTQAEHVGKAIDGQHGDVPGDHHGADGHHAAGGHHEDPSAHFNWTDIGYKGKNIMGEPLSEGGEPMSAPIILMLVNFGVVLIILGWKVAPLLSRHVEGRHDSIKQALEEAAKLREAARAKLDEYTERVKKAESEVDKMIADFRADAEAEKQRILADAEAQAAALKRDAESRIAAEIERARLQLEREVVAAAVTVAERLLRERTTNDDQIKLIDTFIHDVQAEASTSARERV